MGYSRDNNRSGGGGRSGGGRGGGGGYGGGGGRDGGRSEMFQATCSDCGRDCEVPFRPSGGKPVFCNKCFKKDGDSGSGKYDRPAYGKYDSNRGDGRGGSNMHKATCSDCGNKCEVPFRPTGAKPVYCSDCFGGGNKNDRRSDDRGGKFVPTKPDQSDVKFEELSKKLDKVLALLEIIHPKKTFTVTKKEADKAEAEVEGIELIGKPKKKAAKKKAVAKKAPAKKKAVAKKSPAKKKVAAKKAPAKKKPAAKKKAK